MKAWDVYLAKVSFEEKAGDKYRPVVILEDGTCYVLALYMTSRQKNRIEDYQLLKYREAGLQKETFVRVTRRLSLGHDAISKKIGRLDPVDILAIEQLAGMLK